jgi:mannose-6-phosphate isomerase
VGDPDAAPPVGAATPGVVLLPPNRFDHFYLGGDRIAALRGGTGGPRRPEEWVASTTTRAGEEVLGLSRLPDGSLLRDRVLAAPRAWLGPEHVERYGGDGVELLVKLLDAGQRLPVHVHPTRAFAREHLGLVHGKTEAWVVVDAEPGAVVGLGLRVPLSSADLSALVRGHESAALVEAVHRVEVQPGDGVLVPAGTPHFIGKGVFVVEVQEPTDLSILLEWEGLAVDGDRDGHLDLGYDLALRAVDRSAWSEADVARHLHRAEDDRGGRQGPVASLLPPQADPYFRAAAVRATPGMPEPVAVAAGLAVLIVLEGAGTVTPDEGGPVRVRRGDVALVPWSAGGWSLQQDGDRPVAGVLCRPPAPDAPEPPR